MSEKRGEIKKDRRSQSAQQKPLLSRCRLIEGRLVAASRAADSGSIGSVRWAEVSAFGASTSTVRAADVPQGHQGRLSASDRSVKRMANC